MAQPLFTEEQRKMLDEKYYSPVLANDPYLIVLLELMDTAPAMGVFFDD